MPVAQVAVTHPGLGFGGSEAPVLRTIEALKGDGDVTLITTGEVDLARLNAYYGTNLAPEDFSIRRAPLPVGLRNTTKFAGLKGSFFQRYVRRVASEFDLLISCYGPMDFGRRGMQMIADFAFVEEWRFSLHPGVHSWKRWWYGSSPIRRVYMTACAMVSGASPDGWKRNLTLANSDWSANLMRQKYGVESQTLYPPVEDDFPQAPFSDRENGFVSLGRISPEKRVDAIVGILSRVRERGHSIHLHILGGVDDSPYGATVKRLADQNRDWVFLEGWAIGEGKKHLLSTHRYGIHGRQNEPFGIAVGEMVNAGCIVFVPNGGGQVEIVNHPALVFNDEADAVDKIEAVLKSSVEQENLRHHLRQSARRFSPESFQTQIRQVVKDFLKEGVVT
ncbi:MAG TPA: glycosyltransferase family 4 protein [Terriglobia bacterium]|nr:glycosyltransferase family 4 protein [Terriglobia bacterium]